ncbi:hypothetical protein JZY91_10775 [Corynebacterium sp. CNCTC7651]|uniref:hypothetical protein n=1 Tax=Corynebacterium sp. CNCTC7651 TaxID=2815361 RepID=UPI001F2191A2|nr:hypothetical protein [Corynebacterium sp. CNCTC7651]UIZ92122.1 hypothetical protein JZY91_10775 [Corynebacterium sp. CNCTC7651]
MADRSNPRLIGVPEVLDRHTRLEWEGLADDASISSVSILDPNGYFSAFQGDLYLGFSDPMRPHFSQSDNAATEDGILRGEFILAVVYSDRSVDQFKQFFETRPSKQRDAFQPYIESEPIAFNDPKLFELRSFPDGAQAKVLTTTAGWEAETVGDRGLKVTRAGESPQDGVISLAVSYPDGSSEAIAIRVQGTSIWDYPEHPKPKPGPGPSEPVAQELGFDTLELDLTDPYAPRDRSVRIVGLREVPVQRVEILDANGWGYSRRKEGIFEFHSGRHGTQIAVKQTGAPESPSFVPVKLNVRVVYTDGLAEEFSETLRIKPEYQVRCDRPEFDLSSVKPGEANLLEVQGLPNGWPLRVTDVVDGAAARIQEDGKLELIVPEDLEWFEIDLEYPCTGEPEHMTGSVLYFSSAPWVRPTTTPSTSTTSKAVLPLAPETGTAPTVSTITTTVRETSHVTTVVNNTTIVNTVVSEAPKTIVSTVREAPVTLANTEKTTVIKPTEPSGSSKATTIVTFVLSLIAAVAGLAATALNFPTVRTLLGL